MVLRTAICLGIEEEAIVKEHISNYTRTKESRAKLTRHIGIVIGSIWFRGFLVPGKDNEAADSLSKTPQGMGSEDYPIWVIQKRDIRSITLNIIEMETPTPGRRLTAMYSNGWNYLVQSASIILLEICHRNQTSTTFHSIIIGCSDYTICREKNLHIMEWSTKV